MREWLSTAADLIIHPAYTHAHIHSQRSIEKCLAMACDGDALACASHGPLSMDKFCSKYSVQFYLLLQVGLLHL